MAKFRDFLAAGFHKANRRADAQLSEPLELGLPDRGRIGQHSCPPPAPMVRVLNAAAEAVAALPPRPSPRPSFEDLWGDPERAPLTRPGRRPRCPLPLPTEMGIYPDAQPHTNACAVPGAAKPQRSRSSLWIGARGERYLRGPRVAAGSFGKMYPVVREDGTLFAGKVLRKKERQMISCAINGQPLTKTRRTGVSSADLIAQERDMLGRVGGHVRILDEGEDMGRHFFIMPWMSASLRDLQRLVPRSPTSADPQRRDLAFMTLASGASELARAHRLGILHLDIKPDNFLTRAQGQLALCDWGLARQLPSGRTRVQSTHGTPAYQAPEIRSDMAAERASDVFSLAVTASVMATGKRPLALYAAGSEAGDPRVADGLFASWRIDVGADLEPSALCLGALFGRASIEPDFCADATTLYFHELDIWAYEMARVLGPASATYIIGDMMAVDPAERPDAAAVANHFSPASDEGRRAQSTMLTLLARHRQRSGATEEVVTNLRDEWAQHRRDARQRVQVG